MSVNLKNFVDINIKTHVTSTITGSRPTLYLFSAEAPTSGSKTDEISCNVNTYLTNCAGMTNTIVYLQMYFSNGGLNAVVKPSATLTASALLPLVKALDNNYVVVGFVNKPATSSPSADDTINYSVVKELATSMAADSTIYGINEKILLSRTKTVASTDQIENLAVKYSSVSGAEMTIAAYLTQLNVYVADSVHDYMFTQEQITAEDITETDYQTVLTNNMNVDISLVGAIRNCGGNLKDGEDLINKYCLIILHQTLTDRLIQLLSQKIKNSAGISKIYSVISQELANYLTCGYLTTDKVWTDSDLVISYNSENYTIIEKGTALNDGYLVKILPYTSLTDADKAAHKTPPIYVVLATQYGIRQITINGEVI